MAMGLLLYMSFFHSTFLSRISDRWTGLISVCVTMASPKAHGTRPPSLPRGIELRKLWGPPLTIVGCGLWCIHPFLRILSLPSGIPESFFLKFLLLAEYLMGWDLWKHLYPPRLSWWGFDLWILLSKGVSCGLGTHFHILITKSDFTWFLQKGSVIYDFRW